MLGISRFLLLLRFAVTTPNQRTKARHITAVSYTVYIGKSGQLRMHTYIVYLTDLHFHMKGIIRPAGLTPTAESIDHGRTQGPTRQEQQNISMYSFHLLKMLVLYLPSIIVFGGLLYLAEP